MNNWQIYEILPASSLIEGKCHIAILKRICQNLYLSEFIVTFSRLL